MATQTKSKALAYTKGANIDAHYGPWASQEEYLTWLQSTLGRTAPFESTLIAVQDSTTKKITKWIYENGAWRQDGKDYSAGEYGIQEIGDDNKINVNFGTQDALINELFSDTSWADGDLVELNPDGGFNFAAFVAESEYDKVYGIRYVRLGHGGAIGSSDNVVTTANVVAIILDGDRHTFDTPLPFQFSGTGLAKVQMPVEFADRVISGVIIQPTADYSVSNYHFYAAVDSSGLIRFKEYSVS